MNHRTDECNDDRADHAASLGDSERPKQSATEEPPKDPENELHFQLLENASLDFRGI